ncbi:hypothetical protein MBRA_56630 (plasmid) [Mycobacterium branderi]|uniref:Uncharacterized protein n=1 Tax=Mycobacterium branderi TaxID=43348 RepID=A0ABM7KWB0_9MYCO|nr:hypothetical protein MBRA_56630 [Mycobacterium branderi]
MSRLLWQLLNKPSQAVSLNHDRSGTYVPLNGTANLVALCLCGTFLRLRYRMSACMQERARGRLVPLLAEFAGDGAPTARAADSRSHDAMPVDSYLTKEIR